MAPQHDQASSGSGQSSDADADLAQAFKDLARGEQTAAALESRLSGLERKIDLLLASVDADATSPSNLTVVAGGQDTQPSANPPGQNGVTDSSGKGEDKSGEGLGSQGR